MNVKQKMGIVGGLVALLGAGCDKELKTVEASCEIAPDVEAKVVYNQVTGGNDFRTIEILYHGGLLVKTVVGKQERSMIRCGNTIKTIHVRGTYELEDNYKK